MIRTNRPARARRTFEAATPRPSRTGRLLAAVGAVVVLTLVLAACAAGPRIADSFRPAANPADLTDADGYIAPGDTLPLTSDKPAITKLNPTLLTALRSANRAAEDQRGITIKITDGWRSERYQDFLFEQAVQKYGSEDAASEWVKRGTESQHVSGDAVDVATADAMDFLNRFGNEWGLCQVYANEIWHFELRTTPGVTCPPMAADGRG